MSEKVETLTELMARLEVIAYYSTSRPKVLLQESMPIKKEEWERISKSVAALVEHLSFHCKGGHFFGCSGCEELKARTDRGEL